MKNVKISYCLVMGITLTLILINMWLISEYSINHIDSDASNDLVLAKMVAENGHILQKDWYYSTDLRVLHTQIVLGLIMKLGVDSWTNVRVLGCLVFSIFLICAFVFFIKKTHLDCRLFYFLPCFFIPISLRYQYLVLFGFMYFPHIIIGIVSVGLMFDVYYSLVYPPRKTYVIKMGILIILSFVAGLGGLRQLAVTYFPIIIATTAIMLGKYSKEVRIRELAADDEFKLWCIEGMAVFSALLGYIVNSKILSQKYTFMSFDATKINSYSSVSFDRSLNDLWGACGYMPDTVLISFSGIRNILVIAFFGIIVKMSVFLVCHAKKMNYQDRNIAFFCIAAIVFNFLLMAFTGEQSSRYYVPVLWTLFPLISIYLCYSKEIILKKIELLSVIIVLLLNGVLNTQNWMQFRNNNELIEVCNYLVENDYSFGYASYWNAGVLTEMSDGKIEMYNIQDWENLDPFKILMKKSNIDKNVMDQVFVLVKVDDRHIQNQDGSNSEVNAKYLTDDRLVFSTDNYDVYRYESTAELFAYIQ